MKHITTRSLATAAVTGALVLGTAGLAQADDDSHHTDSASQHESTTRLGAPISFGGLTFTNESSASDAQQDSSTDDDGDGTSSSSSHSTDGTQTIHIGAFTIDPSFLTESADAQKSSEHSTDDGDDVQRSDESSSAQRTDANAPATFDGAHVGSTHDEEAAESTTRHDDGDVDTEGSHTESHSEQGLDLQKSTIDPLLGSSNGEHESLVESILN